MLPTRYYATNHNFFNASQKDKNMTRVKSEVINVKVVLEFIVLTLTILPGILFPHLYLLIFFVF
jgi:hypothetical protein